MTTLQFTLFFVALVLALALVHIQLAKLQAKLDELARLGRIEERMTTIVQAIDRLRLEPLEAVGRDVRSDLATVVEVLGRIEQVAARPVTIPAPPPVVAPDRSSGEPTAAEHAHAAIVAHLASLGCAKIRVLTDLATCAGEDDFEVLVECERGTMPCKGKLTLRGSTVRDAQIQMLAQMFP